MPSVYIETTIPSYYYSTRTSAQALAWRQQTRLWWDRHRHHYELFTSLATIDELEAAPAGRGLPRIALLSGIEILAVDSRIETVAAQYLDHKLMPRSAKADALHVALASCHAMDFLLTWNCRHIANANKTKHLATLNERLGLHVPIMATPYNLPPEAAE